MNHPARGSNPAGGCLFGSESFTTTAPTHHRANDSPVQPTPDHTPDRTPDAQRDALTDTPTFVWSTRTVTYATLGVLCFVLGGIGALVPGLPTTVFLLLGSFFLTRSCPWLENKMLDSRLFRGYATFIRSNEPMRTKSRIIALSMMWLSIACSTAVLALTDKLTVPIAAVIGGLGVIGTVWILLFRRAPNPPRN
jgi:uncharacterized membrane protein YbaN (DUF454 family)